MFKGSSCLRVVDIVTDVITVDEDLEITGDSHRIPGKLIS